MTTENNLRPALVNRIACNPNIAIRIKNGTAVLSGWACSDEQKLQAEKAIKRVAGIDQVFNMVKTNQG